MEYKKTIILLALVVFLLSIAGVSASEIDDTIASVNANTIELSADNDIEDNLQTSEENMVFTSTDYDEALSTQTDTEVLGADSATYFDLADEISHSGNITLTHKNYTYNGGGTITIREANKVIDGNGAVIDMNGSTIRAFQVSASGVTIKNLTIKNANYGGHGGAIRFSSAGTVSNCNFTNNTAYGNGGAVYFSSTGTVSNCNFVNNSATGEGRWGSAIRMYSGNVSNCNFTGNTATKQGGAIWLYSGSVSNCNFTNNKATGDNSYGGAVYFSNTGSVSNCNFTNNKATGDNSYGGAVYFHSTGSVINCNFADNTATRDGGAVYFSSTGNVTNCNFTNNSASSRGGAVYFSSTGNVSNCNFTNNKATGTGNYDGGGAVYFYQGTGSLTNCNFTDNTASSQGGAIRFSGSGTVSNCNFTNNTANYGGSVYFVNDGEVTNCNFTDNEAFYGGAVFFYDEGTVTNCNFTNNTATYGGGAIRFSSTGTVTNCNFTDNTASRDGGAVYFNSNGEVTNCNFVNNSASSNGGAVYFKSNGNVTNCNFTNNKATEDGGAINMGSGTVTNCNFTNNKATRNGGAINMGSGTVTNCNFTGNTASGNGGAVYFPSYGDVTNCNFTGNTASGNGGAVYFYRTDSVSNCNFIKNSASSRGGAVYFSNPGSVSNCNFTDNTASGDGGAVYFYNPGSVSNCNFTNNTASLNGGGAVYFNREGAVTNCNFVNNKAAGYYSYGGAVYFSITGTVTNCNFTNNKATRNGGAVYFYRESTVTNCNFTDNTASGDGGAVFFIDGGDVSNCNFTDNTATQNGGAIRMISGSVENCNFTDNSANYGGAVYFLNNGEVTNCNFTNNKATGEYSYGGAVYFLNNGEVTNCNFTDNTASGDGGAIYFSNTGSVSNCNFTDNTASGDGGAIYFLDQGTVTNCNFTNNTAEYGGSVYFNGTGEVTNCNFADNTAYRGGAVYFSNTGSVSNCNFTDNTASGDGGAVYFNSNGEVTNCNFINNNATGTDSWGGAVFFNREGTVTNCNFINNKATGEYSYGGAVWIYSGSVSNCNFTDNTASGDGGAVYFSNTGSVSNCNFTDNSATVNGGAVYFHSTGSVTNCNFVDNTATYGGAVYFENSGNVTNCNFTNNKATGVYARGGAVFFNGTGEVTNCNFTGNTVNYDGGGAVYFLNTGNVSNCNFVNNSARFGGAVYFNINGEVTNCNFTGNTANFGGAVWMYSGSVENCNFTGNNAFYGGAVYFDSTGNVSNCNFINNTALQRGGAVYFFDEGTVTNCNFTGNNATTGSAIYFYSTSATKTVSNSRFLNNRANAEVLEITKNDNNITITFTGRNNLLNAIYSSNDAKIAFYNVTHWGAKGITTVSSTMSGSNKAAGQNITVGVVVNNELVLSDVMVTNESGMIVLDISAGENYYIGVRHDTDSYYTEAEKTISNNINVNVTSQTTTNKTVNITAKSNIYSEVMPGKLLFILPNGTQIEATYGANGTWWAEHTFDAYGEYKVNATYVGLDNVTINNGTITINKVNSTITLDNIVLDYGETKNVTVTTTGATGITAKIDGNNVTVINNYTIPISGLGAGNYTLTVTTIPDDDHNPVTKEVNITVNKVNSTLTVNDIVFDYGSSGSTVVSLTGAYGVNATVVGQPKTVVKVNGTNITVSDLDAGTYTLTVTTIADKNHNNITKNATITVNKVNGTLTLDDVVLDYGESKNITVTTEGATGITAKIDGVNVTVNDYIIPISGLGAGNYTLTVTTIADKNHNPVTKEANITVNKVESTLTVGDIVFDYGSEGSGDVSFTGASEVTANVVNQPSAVVSVSGNKISVSGLAAGTYTLNVTTVPDENHTAVTETAGITVNKINSTLTLDDVVLDYGESKNITVAVEGATGISAKIDGVNVTVNNYIIPISGLCAGNHTLSVTTLPDDNHNPVNVTSKITVNKVESTLTVGGIVFDYDGEGSGDVSFTGASEVTANVVNQPSAVVSVSGNKISVSGLAAGTYTLNVTTVPDENHTAVTETSTITVNKINSTLTLDDVVLDYGESKNITVAVEGATGISAKIDGVDVTVNGYTIPISGLGAGNYTLTVTTIADANHNNITKNATITVNKVNATLTVGDIVFDYDGEGFGDVSFTGASEVTANVVNQPSAVVSVSGNKISVSGLAAGTYTLNVTTVPDENHTAVTETATITVNKVNSTLTLDDVVLDYGETKNITVTTEGATGITAKIDGVNVTVSNYTIPISGLGAGNYTLTVTTIADKNHNPVTKEANITVNKLSTEIILANETLDLKVGDEVPVLANLTPAGAGNLTFTSSNEDLVFVEDNVTIVANSQGQAIITVSFAGNENYAAAENKTITVNVALNDASVSVENDTLNLKVDETSAINATIEPDTIMLKIKYTSSNESVATVDKNGIVTAVGEGRAIITIEVGDDEIYAKNSTTVTVTVNKINTTADVSIPENITVGDNSTVNVILPADAKGNVTVKVDGEVVDTVPVKDGNADVTIPSISAGNHTVEIAYSGDGKYNPINETKDITVSKNDITPEIIIPSEIEFDDNATVDIKLPGDATGNVTLTVDGKEINTVPVTNGTASVKLPALDAGNHTAEIAYSGDDKYKPASKTTTISIDKDSTKITAADVTATYNVNKYLVITLKDSKGNPLANATVTVDLNTIKNYTADENGQIKIKVSNLVPKSYSAKITFAGNNNYLGSDATAKVVVKKATPKITASNKMFKTTTKNKKYTITLKDNTGKPIKNAKVYLKVNGKTYKATTNSKGKATFKITKLSKTGTFKATVTYKGNKYYNKASKKVTVKVISTWKTISKGSKAKSTVKDIQRALKNNGYYLTAYGHYLKVDGIYWDYTVKAVKQFQKAKGLKVTGKVDEKTAKKLGLI